MIKSITKTQENNQLKVEVECFVREFASKEIILLTTDKLIDILLKDNIIIEKTIQEPTIKVGNSNVKKVSTRGVWLFQVAKENKIENSQPKKPKQTRARKKPTTPSDSIRKRMSNLATKKD